MFTAVSEEGGGTFTIRLLTFLSVVRGRLRLVCVSLRSGDGALAIFLAPTAKGAAVLPDGVTEGRALRAAAADLTARDLAAALPATSLTGAFTLFGVDAILSGIALSLSLAAAVTLRDTTFSEAAAFICAALAGVAAVRARAAGDFADDLAEDLVADDLAESFFPVTAVRDFAFVFPALTLLDAILD